MADEKELIENRDSIKVSRTTTGKYSFEIKRYYDFKTEPHEKVIKSIEDISKSLSEKFKSGGDGKDE